MLTSKSYMLRKWQMGRVVRGLDRFGQPVPQLNIEGEKSVSTLWGGVLSTLVLMIALSYAVQSSFELAAPRNPLINTIVIPGFYGNDEKYTLEEANFKLAFTLYDEHGSKTLNSTRYLNWTVLYKTQYANNTNTYETLPFH